eukprot:CAMPEP_0182854818 /NCGR_PEP_ID=MMETSP0034_2-20130328/1485_1 /TAXON_ID=156128 /ORGANISM="Nephroselmis pyriformis, Strain CCMP717" /LENGTH=35 /DNA_ID= /DNA_START= /DNA_END= /DNA_ORIENTATION=
MKVFSGKGGGFRGGRASRTGLPLAMFHVLTAACPA